MTDTSTANADPPGTDSTKLPVDSDSATLEASDPLISADLKHLEGMIYQRFLKGVPMSCPKCKKIDQVSSKGKTGNVNAFGFRSHSLKCSACNASSRLHDFVQANQSRTSGLGMAHHLLTTRFASASSANFASATDSNAAVVNAQNATDSDATGMETDYESATDESEFNETSTPLMSAATVNANAPIANSLKRVHSDSESDLSPSRRMLVSANEWNLLKNENDALRSELSMLKTQFALLEQKMKNADQVLFSFASPMLLAPDNSVSPIWYGLAKIVFYRVLKRLAQKTSLVLPCVTMKLVP